MQTLTQSTEQRDAFLKELQDTHELVAPVKEDLVRFKKITDPSIIHLETNAYFPLKEYFFRKKETLFLFIGKQVQEPKHEPRPRAFFGVRRCDLNAIRKQDLVYLHDVHDPYYAAQRAESLLMGYHCETPPSKACFCGSMELEDFHDLMYYEKDGAWVVEVGSERGEAIVKEHEQHFQPYHRQLTQEEHEIKWSDRLKKADLKSLYEHDGWKEGVGLCLSCGACTTLCPTCYCFEIHDEVEAEDPSKGERVRSWSSCMLQEFTRVAGDHVFRKDREQRFKHRIYHQLDYFKDKYGEFLCVGCGRCIDGCPTRIDFVDIINRMES